MTSSSLRSASGSSFFKRSGSMGTLVSALPSRTPARSLGRTPAQDARFLRLYRLAVLEEAEARRGGASVGPRPGLGLARLGLELQAAANLCQGAICLRRGLGASGCAPEGFPRHLELAALVADPAEEGQGPPVPRVHANGALEGGDGLVSIASGEFGCGQECEAFRGFPPHLAKALERPLRHETVAQNASRRTQFLVDGRARQAARGR